MISTASLKKEGLNSPKHITVAMITTHAVAGNILGTRSLMQSRIPLYFMIIFGKRKNSKGVGAKFGE